MGTATTFTIAQHGSRSVVRCVDADGEETYCVRGLDDNGHPFGFVFGDEAAEARARACFAAING
jgi:hypothetical protein